MTNKTWGGRFQKNVNPLLQEFNSSLPFDYILYEYDILGSQIHAKMLGKQGLLIESEVEDICKALQDIKSEFDQGKHTIDTEHEDIHMYIEHLLVDRIGDAGKKLHTGRSRNDQVALDLRLYSREVGNQLQELLGKLINVCKNLVSKHANDLMPGYTHMQQAQPISLGKYLGAYLAMFERDSSRLDDWRQRMNFSPLGAGAFAGSNLPLDREYVAQELGFNGVIENTVDAVSDRDYIIEFNSNSAIIMMHLSRLCEDLIIWATQEFNFLVIDDSFATGSSLMPNKKNPDVPELVRGKSGRVFGHLISILTTMKGLPLAYNKDMQEDKEVFFDTVNTVTSCLSVMTSFLQNITFNTQVMAKSANSGYLDATKVLELLVMEGMPFRDAHKQVGKWVAEAISKGVSLNELLEGRKPYL